MNDKLDVVDVLNKLGEPYTFERKRPRLPWWLADKIGQTYLIQYEGQTIRKYVSSSYTDVKEFVNLLNRAYQTGVADCMGITQVA